MLAFLSEDSANPSSRRMAGCDRTGQGNYQVDSLGPYLRLAADEILPQPLRFMSNESQNAGRQCRSQIAIAFLPIVAKVSGLFLFKKMKNAGRAESDDPEKPPQRVQPETDKALQSEC